MPYILWAIPFTYPLASAVDALRDSSGRLSLKNMSGRTSREHDDRSRQRLWSLRATAWMLEMRTTHAGAG
jgi:hypothetical protein